MHCLGLSKTFQMIYNNTCRWSGQNFFLKIWYRSSNPANILELPEDYNTGREFFILLYFVFFFSLPLQTECVASNQPLTFTYFPRKYLSFPCFTVIFESHKNFNFFTKKIAPHKLTLQFLQWCLLDLLVNRLQFDTKNMYLR